MVQGRGAKKIPGGSEYPPLSHTFLSYGYQTLQFVNIECVVCYRTVEAQAQKVYQYQWE